MSNPAENNDEARETRIRNWASVPLTTGYYLTELVDKALSLCDSRVSTMAVRNVSKLLEAGCKDEHEWRNASDTLYELCSTHPDREQSSGGWLHGPAPMLAMAAAMEVAHVARYRLHPTVFCRGEADGANFKAFKYLLQAFAQAPDKAGPYMAWIERMFDMPQR